MLRTQSAILAAHSPFGPGATRNPVAGTYLLRTKGDASTNEASPFLHLRVQLDTRMCSCCCPVPTGMRRCACSSYEIMSIIGGLPCRIGRSNSQAEGWISRTGIDEGTSTQAARRCHDPPPGNTVIWIGLSRLTDIELGIIIGVQFVDN